MINVWKNLSLQICEGIKSSRYEERIKVVKNVKEFNKKKKKLKEVEIKKELRLSKMWKNSIIQKNIIRSRN